MRTLVARDLIRVAAVVQVLGLLLLGSVFFGISAAGIGSWMLGVGLLVVGGGLYITAVLVDLRRRQAI